MQKSTLSLILLGLICASSVGWYSGRSQMAGERIDVRQELLNEIAKNRDALAQCMANMQNQYTPGYRSARLLPDPANIHVLQTQGKIFRTQTHSNLAINGRGFFQMQGDQETIYTRDGRFVYLDGAYRSGTDGAVLLGYEIQDDGQQGDKLVPISLPMDPRTKLYAGRFTTIEFDEEGTVTGALYETGEKVSLFRVALAGFANPELLERAGLTSLKATEEANLIRVGVAGQWDLGAIAPGSLEMSNVDFMEQAMIIGALRQHAGLLGDSPAPSPPAITPPASPVFSPATMNSIPSMSAGADPLAMTKFQPHLSGFNGFPTPLQPSLKR